MEFRPQKGQQESFLTSKADIVIYGGAAGGGKTYGLLLECLRHKNTKGFSAVIFRRESTQVRNPGGLWDTSMEIFPFAGGIPKESSLEWKFSPEARVKFAHMEHDKDRFSWQGSQIPLVAFDELTHFSWSQFVYMLSRNRSTCGVKPYIRATTNPDPDSWVRTFIDWWIDHETGYPIPSRSGVVRWFIVVNDQTYWSTSRDALLEQYPDALPKSVTFIASTVHDNQILLSKDPGYISNLQAMPKYEREQLLMGNWNIRPTAGMFFQRSYFEKVRAVPKGNRTAVRYWDRASTKETGSNDPDWTVGVKLEKDQNGIFYITDIVRLRESPLGVQMAIKNTATQDGFEVKIGIEQDPGQAGVSEADYLVRQLSGFQVSTHKVQKDKVTRALPVSSQAEANNIKILEGRWNEDFLREAENFPEGSHDDQIDALSGAFNMMVEPKYNLQNMSRW
jgi:predicted phage terminase large subunit-like protein